MIGGQELVEIDSFGGEPIRTCGLEYSGTIVIVFWDTLTRGLRKEIVAHFEWIEKQVQSKSISQAEQTIDICAGQLITFAEAVRRAGVAKDRTLRSRQGVRPSECDQGRWEGADRDAILRQARGLVESLKASTPSSPRAWERGLLSKIPGWAQFAAALVTIALGVAAFL